MNFLRQNTAVIVTVGPFYDKTDGVTIETGLTITNERITLTADTDAGSAPTNILDNVTGATSGTANDLNYISSNDAGMMQLELAAADTNRVGRMMLSITDAANHVPVFHEFFVLPAAIYDWLTGVIVPLPANVTQLLGTAWLTPGTAGTPDVNVKLISADATAADNAEAFFDGTGYAGTNNVIPLVTTTTTATNVTTVNGLAATVITAASIAADAITAAKIADGAIDAATFAASAITSTVLANDAITAAKLHADVTTELQSGLATAAALDAVDNFVDTEIAAIQTTLQGVVLAQGTIGATGNDTTHLHIVVAYADDGPNSMMVVIKDVSTGLFYSRWIEDFANTGDLVTVATLPFTPEASVDLYWMLPMRADVTGGSGLDAAGVRAAVGLASANLDTQLGTIDDFLDTEVAAIKTVADAIQAKTDNLPSDPADASVVAGLIDAVDNFVDTEVAAIKTVVDAIQAKTDNLPTDPADASDVAALVTAVDDLVDTEVAAIKTVVDAIKVKTDPLTYTIANVVDANIQRVNDVAIIGDGSGTPWGP